MGDGSGSSEFQEALEVVEALEPDDQALLIAIIRHRLIEQRRAELVSEIAEARAEYADGRMHRGTIDDLLAELDQDR